MASFTAQAGLFSAAAFERVATQAPAGSGAAAPHSVAPPPASRRRTPRAEAMRLCVLGSGSGGNCTVLQHRGRTLLIDAGFGPVTTARRMRQARLDPTAIDAVVLTHLDRDHFRPAWLRRLPPTATRLFLHRWHADELARLDRAAHTLDAGLVQPFADEPFEPWPGLTVSTLRLQHDRQGTIGYRFDADGASVGYATDLGHAPPALIDHLAGVDLLCLESNYDEHMTLHSLRPTFVNRRNLSDSGHLSNDQAFDAVRHIADASPRGNPRHVLLMHRSRQCNHPMKVRRVFERDPVLARRVTLTEQRRRTRWFAVTPLKPARRAQLRLTF